MVLLREMQCSYTIYTTLSITFLHRRYFGEKVAIYFAWLGFITMFLTIATVAGIIIQIMGLLYTFGNNPIS